MYSVSTAEGQPPGSSSAVQVAPRNPLAGLHAARRTLLSSSIPSSLRLLPHDYLDHRPTIYPARMSDRAHVHRKRKTRIQKPSNEHATVQVRLGHGDCRLNARRDHGMYADSVLMRPLDRGDCLLTIVRNSRSWRHMKLGALNLNT